MSAMCLVSFLLVGACGGSGGGGAVPNAKRIFVTSGQFGATLGGLSGADALCATAATAAALGGGWQTWLSDSKTNAIDRITSDGPWYLVDRTTKVFNNKANLMTTPLVGISSDEQGNVPNLLDLVWTGTLVGGMKEGGAPNGECGDWSIASTYYVATGNVGATGSAWTQRQPEQACSNGPYHVYCIEL